MKKKIVIITIFSIVLLGVLYKKYQIKLQKDSTVLVVGTSADYPPYEFIDTKTDQIVGFDIDVMHEIAHRLGKKLIIKNLPFTTLIFELIAGEVDVVAAGMSPTPRREKFVTFTDIYLEGDPYVIVSKKDIFAPKGLQDLKGKDVVVNSGHTAEAFMSKQEAVKLMRLKDVALGLIALQTGSADAFVSANSVIRLALEKKNNAEQFIVFPLVGTGDSCAFAVDRRNVQLAENINKVLFEMKQNGTLEQLKHKWNL